MIQWLKGKSETITSAAAIVASFSVLSRLVGFIRDRILAGAFGAGDVLDVYFAAFRIPDLLFQLMVVGALSASFIPLFTKYEKSKSGKQWELTNKVLHFLALLFGGSIVLGIIFMEPLASVVAPGFDASKQQALVQMARVMFAAQFLLAISMVFGSVLQGAKNFFLYSLAPIFYNIGIIAGVFFFVPIFGFMGLAWGVILGAFLHLVLQYVGVGALGYRYRPMLRFRDPDVRYTIRHMIPRMLGLAVNQINFLLMTIIASTLAVGSVAILQFAYNLNFFAVGVIGVSYAVAAFPTLCEFANQGNKTALIATFEKTARHMLLFLVPATILFILLRAQVVRLVVGAGAFDWESTILTANTLGFFALSLIFQSFVYLLVRMYFAQGQTKAPFVYGIVASVIFGLSAFLLKDIFGVMALGMAFSLSACVQALLLWVTLRVKLGSLSERLILKSLFTLILAGIGCAVVTQGMKYAVVAWIDLDTFWSVFAQLIIAGGSGLLIYGVFASMLGSGEMREFVYGIKKRFLKRSKPQEAIVTHMQS